MTSGLVLQLESDANVTLSGSTVTTWGDGSGQANDLSGVDNPQLISSATPSGADAIRLDGVNDKLERTSGISGLPTGAADRTMFFVVSYTSGGSSAFAGLAYGTGANNQTFGLVETTNGLLAVQAWGGGNDQISSTTGEGAGWLVQSVVLSSNNFDHFLNGSSIDNGTHTWNTVIGKIVIGEETAGAGFNEMDVAAALIYDRALTSTERQQVENYLQNKYVSPPGCAISISSSEARCDNNGSSNNPGDDVFYVDITATVASGSGQYVITDGSTTWGPFASGSQGSAGPFTADGSATSGTLTVQDNVDGNCNATAGNFGPVTPCNSGTIAGCNLITSGLAFWLESDAGIIVKDGVVQSWADQGGGLDLSGGGTPRLVSGGGPNGNDAVYFDGSGAGQNDKLERLSGNSGLPTGNSDRTLFTVVRYQSNGWGGFTYGSAGDSDAFGLAVSGGGSLAIQGWASGDQPSSSTGNGGGWLVQSAVLNNNDFFHYRNGVLIDNGAHNYTTTSNFIRLGVEIDGSPYLTMQTAAALIYNRALTAAERQQVEGYLQEKYLGGTCAAFILPAELLSFTARPAGAKVELRWSTAVEEAFAGFRLQRSSDGKQFTDVAWIPARGGNNTTHYKYTDEEARPGGVYYYRLRMEDYDGSYEFSPLQVARLKAVPGVALFPNPAKDVLHVRMDAEKSGQAQLEVLNSSGVLLRRRAVELPPGSHQLDLELDGLPAGVYLLRAVVGSRVEVLRFVCRGE